MPSDGATDDGLSDDVELLRAIVRLADDGVVSVDEDQRVRLFNAGAERIFGYDANEVLGRSLDMLLPDRHRAGHAAEHLPGFARAHVASRRMGERREVVGRRKSGEEFPADVAIAKATVNGRPVYTAIVRDVTERHRVHATLHATSEALDRSDAESQEFVHIANHDLQEPLRMVVSYTQLLQRRYHRRLDARADRYIAHAVTGAQRMQRLIDDLLALSRVTSDRKERTPTDVGVAVQLALRSLRDTIVESGATFDVGPLPTLTANAAQLELLFQHIFANALKFRRPGLAPHVEVSTAGREDVEGAPRAWLFAVRDDGIGFEPRYAEQIFGLFQRLHGRGEYEGTGVGLAICKRIVERHGGRIWAEGAPSAGVTIHFSLPA